MSVSPHYDEEALIALLDRPRGASGDEHVSSCTTCRDILDSYRSIIETLGDRPVWNFGRIIDEPVKKTITALRAAAASMRSEDAEAEALFAELTAGLREEWMPRLRDGGKYRTGGVVRRLMAATETMALKSPAEILDLTALAIEIADHLDPSVYTPEVVCRLRGAAWRDRAYALNMAGDSAAALEAIGMAEAQYARVAILDNEKGRVELTKALVLRGLDRFEEGLRCVEAGRRSFAIIGDTYRLNQSISLEAYLRYRAGDVRRALQLWIDLERRLGEHDRQLRPSVLHNIAMAYRELGDVDAALRYLELTAAESQTIDNAAEMAKTRWGIARLLVVQGRYLEADTMFVSVIASFEELNMREDVVLASLDRAEIFTLQQRYDDVIAICQGVVAELERSRLGSTMRALTAVSYLREATLARTATPELVRHVRKYVSDSRTQPALLFMPVPE